MKSLADVSIVIPAYRSKYLNACLEAIESEYFKEIIVVDSSPTPTLAEESVARNVRYFHLKDRLFPGAARNFGARHAKGQILFFLDSDVEPTIESLEFLCKKIETPGYFDQHVLVGPYSTDDSDSNTVNRLNNKLISFRLSRFNKNNKLRYGLSSHMVMSQRAFKRAGGFDESSPMLEDIGLCIVMQKLGYTVSFHDEFSCRHKKFYSVVGLLGDYFSRSRAVTFFKNRQRRLFREINNPMPPTWVISWLMILALPFLSHTSQFTSIALGALASTLWLCRPIVKKLTWKEAGYFGLLWPFLGFSLIAGYLTGTLENFFGFTTRVLKGSLSNSKILVKLAFQNGNPIGIVHFLTARCNLRCEHCFYKSTLNNPDAGEIKRSKSAAVYQQAGPLIWYSVGGGEPFIRDDLPELVSDVSLYSKPWIITIPTNGWYTEKTIFKIRRILEKNPHQTVILYFSVDGTEEQHDLIRGKGSWKRLQETHRLAKQLTELYKNFHLGILTVVGRTNYRQYPQLIETLAEQFSPNQIAINLERIQFERDNLPQPEHYEAYRKATETLQQLRQIGKTSFRHWGEFLVNLREIGQKKIISAVAKNYQFSTPCKAGNLFYTIWEDGRVAPCEMLTDSVGNVHDTPFSKIVSSVEAKNLRRQIVETKCRCTYECAASITTISSPWYLLQILYEVTLKRPKSA